MEDYKLIFTNKQPTKPFISAALIVKNCENRIKECIKSIEDIVDEIVIVDDFSTDNSVEVIKNLSRKVSKIVQHKLTDFSVQRNICLDLCDGQYNMIIDDDEIASEALRNSIKNFIKNSPTKDIYFCKRVNHNFHGSVLEHLNYPVLLKKNIRFSGSLHETVNGESSYIKGFIKGFIEHYPDPSIYCFITDLRDYSKRKAESWLKEGRKYPIYILLARQTLVAVVLLVKRLLVEKRIKDGFKAIIYCIAWMSEEFFVALWYIKLRNKLIS